MRSHGKTVARFPNTSPQHGLWYSFLVKKILIIYSKTGGGHLSLALALKEALSDLPAPSSSNGSIVHSLPAEASEKECQFSIVLLDPFPKIYASGYKTVGANFQESWGKNFHLTNRPELAKVMHNLNDAVVSRKLIKIIKKENPDVVITTHFFASVELEKAIKKVGSKAKIMVAVADPFTPHAVWFTYKNADLYLSPTKEVTELMVENEIDKDKIKTTGWLVRKEFREDPLDVIPTESGSRSLDARSPSGMTRKADSGHGSPRFADEAGQNDRMKILRKILGFSETKFTIFIGGSGQGGGKILELVKAILDSKFLILNSQLIIVVGQNRQLMGKLMKLTESNPQLFHLFPYVNNVRELMSASDIVVGKAGPNVLFEAIFMLKPFLATGCLPGQEEGNLEFIKRENLGWVMGEPAEAVKLLEELAGHRQLIEEKLPNLQRIRSQHLDGAKNAATEIAKLIQ